MNNNASGTIAGLQPAHFGLTYGTRSPATAPIPSLPNYAAVAARLRRRPASASPSAADFRPSLAKAIALDRPVVLDVAMRNNPTPTTGHWNILDIYSPGERRSHLATD